MTLNIGTNTQNIQYYSTELPFLNLVKNMNGNVAGVFQGFWNGSAFVNYTQPNASGTSIISIASPAVVSWTNHNLVAGAAVQFSTTGNLPTGIGAFDPNAGPAGVGAPIYLVSPINANSFNITDLEGNLINTTGSQSGTQTVSANDLYNFYHFYLDANGYPISLTSTAGSQPGGCPQGGWNAWGMQCGVNTPTMLKKGNYVFLWDGNSNAQFDFTTFNSGGSVTQTSGGSGRIIVNLANDGQVLCISGISVGSGGVYPRNFRAVYSPDSTPTFVGANEALLNQGEIFNPLFIKLWLKVKAFRFMNWFDILGNCNVNWSDRAKFGWVSWCENYGYWPAPDGTGNSGGAVPFEVGIALFNKLNAVGALTQAWINIPALASDDYITQLAKLVHTQLSPNLTCYVEFGNEMWNTGALTLNIHLGIDAYINALFPGNTFTDFQSIFYWGGTLRPVQQNAIWKSVWGADSSRLRMLSAGQMGFVDRNRGVLQGYGQPVDYGDATFVPGSPSVVNWTGHPLSVNQPIMFLDVPQNFNLSTNTWVPSNNAYPTGINSHTTYFVSATGFGANSFQFSATIGGASVNTTGSNTTLPIQYWNGSWPPVTITVGNPTVVNWTGHGRVAGSILSFMGVLPTGMVCNKNYYVMSAGLLTNSFQLTDSPGGAAITTSGSSSGVQPILFAGVVGQNTDAFTVAPYFGYATPNSWSANNLDLLFQEILQGSAIPTASMGLVSQSNYETYTLASSGRGYPPTPANSSLITFTMPLIHQTSGGTGVISVGTPASIAWTGHGLVGGDGALFGFSGVGAPGSLIGINAGQAYLVNGSAGLTANAFQITDLSGNPIGCSGTLTGTVTVTACNGFNPVLKVDGGTTFPLLDGYGIPIQPGVLASSTNFGNGISIYSASLCSDTSQHNVGATVSINIATSVFTLNNHNLVSGQFVCFETTGALPTGLTPGQVYYVYGANLTANTFQLLINQNQGNPVFVTLSGSQSGTHTLLPVGWRIFGSGLNLAAPIPQYPPGNFGMLAQMFGWTYADYKLCSTFPLGALPMCCYEAGQSLLAGGGANNEVVNQAYYSSAMSDPRMKVVYETLFKTWDSFNPGALIINYADIGTTSTFGFWTVLETVYQTSSPRYDAMQDLLTPTLPLPSNLGPIATLNGV